MNQPDPEKRDPDIPPIVAWFSRNGGWLLLLALFAVAMIEGVAIYASKR